MTYSGQKKACDMTAEEKVEARRRWARPEASKGDPVKLSEVEKEQVERSAAFIRATQRKGQPTTYGTGKPPQA